jgi:tagaturonate epimerase
VRTIAPKFTGRFNKGVDYQGDVTRFNREFSDDVCVIRRAIADFGLPAELKLSVHSGSDKFSIYPGIRRALAEHKAGVHIKTAGTTWLEELIGLAEAGGDAALMVQEIYSSAYHRFDELCLPYSTVIDIDKAALPLPATVAAWSHDRLARSIRHDGSCPDYDRNLRQLLHVGYKVAAELGDTYLQALKRNREIIGRQVCDNLLERHIRPLFL